jgi:hypothetical protein
MTAAQIFALANPAALLGWLVLAFAVLTRNAWLRDEIAGRWWPLGLAGLYSVLIFFFFAASPGGFDTLANVQLLFASPWAALAGWVHYLAFDLFIGAVVARRVMEEGLPRLSLLVLLPVTLMFGPLGLLLSEIARVLLRPAPHAKT